MKEGVPIENLFEKATKTAETARDTAEKSEAERLETEIKEAIQESAEVRVGVDFIKNNLVGTSGEETQAAAEEAAYFAQQNLDALNAVVGEANLVLHPEAAVAEDATFKTGVEGREQKGESFWSRETKTTMLDSIDVTAPENFSEQITQYLSSLQLPRRLYAGDKIAPIRPIDVLAATAEKMGAKDKKLIFTIGEVPYMDISEDGQALVVCLSKYELTNPRTGLLGTLSLKTRNQLSNQGEIVMNKATRKSIYAQTTDHVFGRARHGEALGYQIPPEHQKAYYRGVDYKSLKNIAEAGGFVGRNSDSLLAMLEPTVWAYTDPGMAESFGGRGMGVVFKMKKQKVDEDFKTVPGWQRWTVNEVMIQPKEEKAGEVTVSLGDNVEQILVFDEEGQRLATEFFPNIPQVNLKTAEDGQRYLIENGEITNEGLEQYYDDPEKKAGYIGQLEENQIFAICQIEKDSTYEDCREKMEAKINELSNQIFSILGIDDPKKRLYVGQTLNLQEIVRSVREKSFYRLHPDVKKAIDQNPEAVNEMSKLYKSRYAIEEVLNNFDSYDDLRQTAEKFKQKT